MRPRDFFKAIRLPNCILTAFAVFIGASIAFGGIAFGLPVLLAMVSAFLVCGAGQSINDYFDFKLDLQKQKNKYLSINSQNKKQLLWLAIALFIIGNALAFLINYWAIAIALVISLLLIIYSWLLPTKKFVGNLVVALGTALPLAYGAAVFTDFRVVAWLAASAFLANWAREIVKDFEDLEADEGKKTTLPMLLKTSSLDWVLITLVGIAIVCVYAPLALNIFGSGWFLIIVTIANLVFIQAVLEFRRLHARQSQKWFKIAMGIALIGFLSGVL